MSDSDNLLTFDQLITSLMDDCKSPPGSLQRDFRGDLSFEDLISSAVSRLQKWSKFDQLNKMRVESKDESISKLLRKNGNSYYKILNLEMALIEYNESIKYSLHPPINYLYNKKQNFSYKNLSFSYANRSAVLFEMGLYDEACTDIMRAVKFGYSQQKLSVRYCKSLIYICLKRDPLSPITSYVFDVVFGKTEAVLDCTLDSAQKKLITEHKFDVKKADIKKSGSCYQRKLLSTISECIEAPKHVLEGQHPHLPGLSNKVEFAAKIKRGRFLIAGEDIYPGILLAIDPGFIAATLYRDYVEEYCSACSKPCKFIFVPCHQCRSAVFCNELCRDEAFKSYHHYECSVLPLFEKLVLTSKSYSTIRIIASLGYSKLHDYVKIFEKEEEEKKPSMAKRGFSSEGIFDSKSYRTVYYLSHHKEKRDTKDLFEKSVKAVVMTFILKKYTTFFGGKNLSSEQSLNNVHFDEREMLIAKLTLRHLMSMEGNATSNCICVDKAGSEWTLEYIGARLQCLFTLFSHSCNPNAFIIDSHAIRSMAFIPKGTEICLCYTSTFAWARKQERHAELMSNYHITCECIACVEDWKTNDEIVPGSISDIRVKCMFGCKDGTLNKSTPSCTKCYKGLKKEQSLYSETYLKHINKIIYGSSSENLKSIERDMALTTENVFTELVTQYKSIFSYDWSSMFSRPLLVTKEVTYNAFKGIYLIDIYCDCPSNYILRTMRECLQRLFLAYSSYFGPILRE